MMRGIVELKLIGRLIGYAIRQRPSIIPITLCGVFSACAELAAVISIVPLGIVATGEKLAENSLWNWLPVKLGMTPNTKFFLTTFLLIWLVRMITNLISLILNAYTSQKLFAHFTISAHAAFVRHLTFADILKHQIGHFFTLAGDEANRGAQIVVGTMRVIPVIVLFTAYVAFVFYQSWEAGVALLALTIVMAATLKGVFRKSLQLGLRQQEEVRAVHTLFFDSLGGLRTVRSFTAEDFVTRRYANLTNSYVWTSFLTEALSYSSQLPFIALIVMVLAAVVGYADNAWLLTNMPIFFAGLMMFTRLMPIASYGLDVAMRLTSNLKAGRNVDEMLKAVSQSEKSPKLLAFSSDERIESISFENVSFRYSADTPHILEDFSCTLRAGRSYALTGPSGTGKSSLVDLLLKFYEPGCGTIRVNGRNIAEYSSESLRSHIILSEQATRIFYGSVLENVRFDSKQGRESAESALNLVGLTELLSTLPDGVDTILAYQGGNFSGGQRQRVGIARALVRQADVLILDESTNALDFETRRRILDTLLASYGERILIFVTHDSYVIERVDEIIELRQPNATKHESSVEHTLV